MSYTYFWASLDDDNNKDDDKSLTVNNSASNKFKQIYIIYYSSESVSSFENAWQCVRVEEQIDIPTMNMNSFLFPRQSNHHIPVISG